MSERLCAVAIMAKESVAGKVKTRLVPPLTREEAAELNTRCLADVAGNIATAAAQISNCGVQRIARLRRLPRI